MGRIVMSDEKFNFTWGMAQDLLNQLGYVQVTGFMLDAYTQLGLTRQEFLCIIHLARFHYNSPKGESRPGVANIAQKMGYGHPNSVYRLVKSLENKKMLLVNRTSGKASIYNAGPFAQASFDLWRQSNIPVLGSKEATPTSQCETPPHSSVTEEKEEAKEKRKKNISPTGERKPDLFDLAQKTVDAREKAGGNYAVPPSAGGMDSFADGPLAAFTTLIAGIQSTLLPVKDRKAWAAELRRIAKRWSTEDRPITPEIMEQAIRAIPDSDIGWKTYTSPHSGNFETDIGPLLLSVGETKQPKVIKLRR